MISQGIGFGRKEESRNGLKENPSPVFAANERHHERDNCKNERAKDEMKLDTGDISSPHLNPSHSNPRRLDRHTKNNQNKKQQQGRGKERTYSQILGIVEQLILGSTTMNCFRKLGGY